MVGHPYRTPRALSQFLVLADISAQEIEAVSARARKKPDYILTNLRVVFRIFMMRGKDSVSIYYCHAEATSQPCTKKRRKLYCLRQFLCAHPLVYLSFIN